MIKLYLCNAESIYYTGWCAKYGKQLLWNHCVVELESTLFIDVRVERVAPMVRRPMYPVVQVIECPYIPLKVREVLSSAVTFLTEVQPELSLPELEEAFYYERIPKGWSCLTIPAYILKFSGSSVDTLWKEKQRVRESLSDTWRVPRVEVPTQTPNTSRTTEHWTTTVLPVVIPPQEQWDEEELIG